MISPLRAAALLGAAAAAYTVAAWAVAPGFYDGIAPPAPYNWVSPPPIFQNTNKPPNPGSGQVKVASNGEVNPGTVFTWDGQASVSFTPGAFVAPADRSPVTITIKPVAGFPDPGRTHLVTNVYCFASSSPLAGGKDVLITLRFSDQLPSPGDVYGTDGRGSWQKLGSTGSAAPYTISVRATSLGCFAGGYPADAKQTAQGPRIGGGGQTLPIIVAVAIVAVILAGIPLAFLRRRAGDAEDDENEEA